jgi:dCTP deaminase
MTLIARHRIVELLCDPASRFAITPILDADQQIGRASVDVRLGPDLVITRGPTGGTAFDPADVDDVQSRLEDYQQYVRRPFGSAVYLHPGDFVLARTLEHVRLPETIAAEAAGRSSWGRLGLVIATATVVQPDFAGTVTLELANLGTIPIVLYVGMRIAQLAFYAQEAAPKGWGDDGAEDAPQAAVSGNGRRPGEQPGGE